MLVDTTVMTLASIILVVALRIAWRSSSAFWIVVVVAIISNVLFLTHAAAQRTDLLTLWAVFFVGPLLFSLPWSRVVFIARRRLLLATVAALTYVVASVAWATLAFNTGALIP